MQIVFIVTLKRHEFEKKRMPETLDISVTDGGTTFRRVKQITKFGHFK